MLNISINPDLQPPVKCAAIYLHYFHRQTFLQHGWLTRKGVFTLNDGHFKDLFKYHVTLVWGL